MFLLSHDGQGVELRDRWRRVNADEKHGSLPPSVLHAYLCIILALIDNDTCPRFCRMNRVKVVGACGLLALSVHFKARDRCVLLDCGKGALSPSTVVTLRRTYCGTNYVGGRGLYRPNSGQR